MDKQCKEWCLINHPENKSKWIWKVSMFRNVHHNLTRPCLKKMASGTWRCMDNFHRKDIVKRCQSHIDVKFPFLKIHYDSCLCLASIDQRTPISLLREKWIQGNYAYFLIVRGRTPFPFLVAEIQLKSKLYATGKDLFIYLSLVDYFLGNIFLITGSLMNACGTELKLTDYYNENVSGKCNLTFFQSLLSP